MNPPEGLTRVSTEELKRLLKYVHSGQLECPLTPTHLALCGLQSVSEFLLDMLRGLERDAVKAVVIAVLAERMARKPPQ